MTFALNHVFYPRTNSTGTGITGRALCPSRAEKGGIAEWRLTPGEEKGKAAAPSQLPRGQPPGTAEYLPHSLAQTSCGNRLPHRCREQRGSWQVKVPAGRGKAEPQPQVELAVGLRLVKAPSSQTPECRGPVGMNSAHTCGAHVPRGCRWMRSPSPRTSASQACVVWLLKAVLVFVSHAGTRADMRACVRACVFVCVSVCTHMHLHANAHRQL